MTRPIVVVVLLSGVAFSGWSHVRQTGSARQDPCADERTAWVGRILTKMETIKPRMTRKDLLKVFTTEGGISTGLHRSFVSRDCPYFQLDVEFIAVGRPERDQNGRVTLVEDDRDIIANISRPYVEFAHAD